ncbi:glycine cleavage system regulatory protein [Microbacterium resistens]|uniref:Glycine cleavage system regulatory protein n=1 Tax=Microbacterium resistens TaxID=156977 RepID=A0ABU1SB93_9MICO|nr:ACT domain-containing protein [Microbacterium resistens]MDR6866850.1 glycine cleavage system regulatory protein [Microbacterium resistens]
MSTLILTVVGSDRPGLVAAVADAVDAHGGNWENSRLAELAGTFAGVIEVSVPDDRAAELQTALTSLDGLLTVVHAGQDDADAATSAAAAGGSPRQLTIQVLGNDRAGIVREISGVLSAHALSIESMTSETHDAAMAGGRLFEAAVVATVPAGADPENLRTELERLAADLQVDITVA